MFRTLLVFYLLVASFQIGAMRLLDGEHWLAAKDEIVHQSLQKGPVTGSDHNPCSEIPGRETGVCKLGSMNLAGKDMHGPPAFPSVVAEFGVAKGTYDQGKNS